MSEESGKRADGRPKCFEVRCPDCGALATTAANGSFVSHKCRSCKKFFTGHVIEGKFRCIEENARTRPIIPVEGPRFKNTL